MVVVGFGDVKVGRGENVHRSDEFINGLRNA